MFGELCREPEIVFRPCFRSRFKLEHTTPTLRFYLGHTSDYHGSGEKVRPEEGDSFEEGAGFRIQYAGTMWL